MISKKFGQIATAGALALSVAFATPAMAGNVTYDKSFEANCQNKTTEVCEAVGQKLSNRPNWLPMVVHGGNDNLYGAARRTALRLNDEGIRAYIVHAPDEDNIDITMSVAFYAHGGTQYSVTTYDNEHISIADTESALYSQAKKAYETEYGKVSQLKRPSQTLALND